MKDASADRVWGWGSGTQRSDRAMRVHLGGPSYAVWKAVGTNWDQNWRDGPRFRLGSAERAQPGKGVEEPLYFEASCLRMLMR